MARRDYEYVWRFLATNDCSGADNIAPGMLCTICGRVLINPHSARCGCRFCLTCVTQYLGGDRRLCPGNEDDCKFELMEIGGTVLLDQAMNNQISRLIIKCHRDGCEYKCELRDMEGHEPVCTKRPVNCSYHSIGCQKRGLISDALNSHLVDENESHATLLMECVGVLQNKIATLTEQHEQLQITVTQQAEQIADLNREMRVVQDENQSMRRQIISLEKNRDEQAECLATMEKDTETQFVSVQEQADAQAVSIEQIREKGAQHGIKLGELEKQVTNEKAERGRNIDEVRRGSLARCDEVALRVRENWLNVENPTRGEFVWCIDTWAVRRVTARYDSTKRVVYSDAFCFQQQGYRMCVSVCPAGWRDAANDLYPGWYLMGSPFNEYLAWPFKGTVTVSVLNQLTRAAHASWIVKSDQYPDDRRWDRPTRERNWGFYPTKPIDVEELSRNVAVCRDDQILIKCVVEIAK